MEGGRVVGETEMVNGRDDEAVVQVEQLRKGYGRRKAVDDVSLMVPRGRVYGLLGPDGAGKSSLMKAMAGVLTYDSGRVAVFGVTVDSERAAESVKARIGFMPQGLGLNLYPELSVEENVDFFAHLRLVTRDALAERKERLLQFTRLAPFRRRRMKQLSGGMKQKLGLMCTLIHQPELLILDEPTTGVDPVSRRDFWTILADLLGQQQTTAIVSTAYMDEASRFQRMACLFGGRVLAEGSPDDLHQRVPGSVVEVKAEPQAEALDRLKARYRQVEAYGSQVRVFIEDAAPGAAEDEVRGALEGLQAEHTETVEPELEDVFVTLIGRTRQSASRGHAGNEPGGCRWACGSGWLWAAR
jgi:ABC-2 type transport system ATP-binding protein